MKLIHDKELTDLNSFKVYARAKTLIEFDETEQLISYLKKMRGQSDEYLVLGEGSNTLFTKDYSGIIIKPTNNDIRIIATQENAITIRAGAGCNWDKFVAHCISQNWWGLENLTSIPGTVGAAPVQNIGAFGTEVAELISAVNCIDLNTFEPVTYTNEQCEFKYRHSIFKNNTQTLITSVDFKLNTGKFWQLRKKPILQELKQLLPLLIKIPQIKINPKLRLTANFENVRDLLGVSLIPPKLKRLAVKKMRERTMPDPKIIGNAGCFFKSPIVDESVAERVKKDHPSVSIYKEPNGKFKISAGDLIKATGWCGKKVGNVGINENRPLIILNLGNASGQEIYKVALDIRSAITEATSITIEFEVVIA